MFYYLIDLYLLIYYLLLLGLTESNLFNL